MKVTAIIWSSYYPIFKAASQQQDLIDITVFSSKLLNQDKELFKKALISIKESKLLFFYRTSEDFWDEIEKQVRQLSDKKIISLGYDQSYWSLSNVDPEILKTCYEFIVYGGEENFKNLISYIASSVLNLTTDYELPKKLPWEGIYHPRANKHFDTIDSYLRWYRPKDAPTIGLIFSRHFWVTKNLFIEDALIKTIEDKGFNVIPVFTQSIKDKALGNKGALDVIKEYFFYKDGRSRIDSLIKLLVFFVGLNKGEDVSDPSSATTGVEIFKELNCPVFQPIVSYYKSIDEWEKDPHGLGQDVGWSIAMPEFEGVIEPIIIGGTKKKTGNEAGLKEEKGDKNKDRQKIQSKAALSSDDETREPIIERCQHLIERVSKWINLKKKPVSQRRVVFVLHNNPCASLEATIGSGAHLDTLESIVRILSQMKQQGYRVEVPTSGKELIDEILSRKAISEFRWTTVEEIIKKGGAIYLLSKEEYLKWWNKFPKELRDRIQDTWGDPPGKEVNGVPAAMVYKDKIVITGIKLKNALVCIQPKRGCAGPRCDGKVCKILHDPDVPPPHQYIATYKFFEHIFKADCIIHVGTHGNLEFLPGKSVGLSNKCLPDICINTIPHLYIYNADNPPEGVIAKRRSYATLVDHMQTVMVNSDIYDGLEELDEHLEQYQQNKHINKSKTHALKHLILDSIKELNLEKELNISLEDKEHSLSDDEFDHIIKKTHEVLTLIKTTQIPDGMHIFGEIPKAQDKINFIYAILKTGFNDISIKKAVAEILGVNIKKLNSNPERIDSILGLRNTKLLDIIDKIALNIIEAVINKRLTLANKDQILEIFNAHIDLPTDIVPKGLSQLTYLIEKIRDLDRRINESKEIDSLLSGFDGSFIPSGPSGLITRGRDDVLPTGRNFYTLDPQKVPTKAAYKVGVSLAQALIDKYRKENNGRYPENIALFWMASDIMWTDGECMAQIMSLIGVRPIWLSNGRVKGFEVIPLSELKRPRIDVTIRLSGIIRDNFLNCVELIDDAIKKVSMLEEDKELNFVKKHTLDRIKELSSQEEDKEDIWKRATMRIFSSKPGTYMAGVNLAVYASSWKTQKDLSDIFVYWNGYGYGNGYFGEKAHQELTQSLKTVDLTFNKVVTDEYDLFGCCCYFGTHGGLTTAAREISGKEVPAYYGDTRELENIDVRSLSDEIRRVSRTKLLNPKWIKGMKRHGYKGASEISKRVGRVFGWQATTNAVDDWIFDEIAKTFVLDKENRKFFEEQNPYALEEISRRLLEAHSRGMWKPNKDILNKLQEHYLEVEGWLEEKIGDSHSEFQGGSVDIFTPEEVAAWKEMMEKELKI